MQDTVALIFDFDGTIAATLDIFVDIANQLATEFAFDTFTPEQVQVLRQLNTYQALQQTNISIWKLPRIIRSARREFQQYVADVEPIPGMLAVLHTLHKNDVTLGIITSNSAQNVQIFLERHALTSHFSFVIGKLTLFGKGKLIRRARQEYGLQQSRVLYVGDEVRDIEAARFAGVEAVAVDWGFNAQTLLSASQPDFLLSDPTELLQFLPGVRSLPSRT